MVSHPILILVAVIAYVTGVIVGRRRSNRMEVWESSRSTTTTAAASDAVPADAQRLALLEQNLLTPALRGERQIAGADLKELMILLERKQLIPAIRRYRQLTGAGLKESKDAMESLQRTLPGAQ